MRLHSLKEPDVLRIAGFAISPYACGSCIGSGIGIWPEPEGLQPRMIDCVQRLLDLSAGLISFCSDWVLHNHYIAPRDVDIGSDAAIVGNWITERTLVLQCGFG